MTDERRPIRQISRNLQEFQGALSELTHITPKVVISQSSLRADSKLQSLARTVDDLYFEPKHEEIRPRTICNLSNVFRSPFDDPEPIPQFGATAGGDNGG
jgi:hypothetical protein